MIDINPIAFRAEEQFGFLPRAGDGTHWLRDASSAERAERRLRWSVRARQKLRDFLQRLVLSPAGCAFIP